jgi:AcrR family transcriptional regulator
MQTHDLTLRRPNPYVPATIFRKPGKEREISGVERRREQRAEILAIARRLLAEQGYERFTIRQIAERSSVTAQTLHNNFGTRTELLAAALNEFRKVTYSYVRSVSSDPVLFLVLGDSLHHTTVNAPDFMRQLIACWSADGPLLGLLQRYGTSLREPVLHEMRRRSVFRSEIDPTAFGAQAAHINSCALHEWALGLIDIEELRRQIIAGNRLLLYGALTPVNAQNIEAWVDQVEHGLV